MILNVHIFNRNFRHEDNLCVNSTCPSLAPPVVMLIISLHQRSVQVNTRIKKTFTKRNSSHLGKTWKFIYITVHHNLPNESNHFFYKSNYTCLCIWLQEILHVAKQNNYARIYYLKVHQDSSCNSKKETTFTFCSTCDKVRHHWQTQGHQLQHIKTICFWVLYWTFLS